MSVIAAGAEGRGSNPRRSPKKPRNHMTKNKPPILLGVEARDTVTGFTGIITAQVHYLTGCMQFCLSPKIDKEGKIRDGAYFDHQRLEYVGAGVPFRSSDTGGPQRDAPPIR